MRGLKSITRHKAAPWNRLFDTLARGEIVLSAFPRLLGGAGKRPMHAQRDAQPRFFGTRSPSGWQCQRQRGQPNDGHLELNISCRPIAGELFDPALFALALSFDAAADGANPLYRRVSEKLDLPVQAQVRSLRKVVKLAKGIAVRDRGES